MDTLYENWIKRWQAALDACDRKGSKEGKFFIGPPATSEAVTKVEAALGHQLPMSFKRVLLDFSAEVEMYWFFQDEVQPPKPFHEILSGECIWSLSRMTEIVHHYQRWLEVFPNLDDSYDRIWHKKLAFADVANGDNIAFDIEQAQDAPVIYLSHDDGEGHGFCLGNNFIDFVDRWSLLGCPGNEDWQMIPFLPNATSGLDPYGENANKWREWFGLDFEVT